MENLQAEEKFEWDRNKKLK